MAGGRGGVTEPLDYGINQKAAAVAAFATAAVVHHPLWQNMLSSVCCGDSAARAAEEGIREGTSIFPLFVRHPPSLAVIADRVSEVISISVSNILLSRGE